MILVLIALLVFAAVVLAAAGVWLTFGLGPCLIVLAAASLALAVAIARGLFRG